MRKTTPRPENEPALVYHKTIRTPDKITRIDVRLDDECRNGHADFSVTGQTWEKDHRGRMQEASVGCIHEEILAVWPEVKIFTDLHLSDSNGAPMYAVENGFYHLHNPEKTPAQRRRLAAEHFQTTPENLAILETAEDSEHLNFLMEELKIPKQWKSQANAAIFYLEKLTGQKWNHDYQWRRSQYTPPTAERRAALAERLASGYYTPAARAKREEEKRAAEIAKKLETIRTDAEKAAEKIKRKAKVETWLILKIEALKKKHPDFIANENMAIYYDHINRLSFNWRNYGGKLTAENFKIFCDSITRGEFQTVLPASISFELNGETPSIFAR